MNAWQKKQAAQGLCIFCNEPGTYHGTKAPKCEKHAKKAQESIYEPMESRAEKRKRDAQIAEFAVAHPFTTLQELGAKFGMNPHTLQAVLRRSGVISGWVMYDKTLEVSTDEHSTQRS